MWDGDSEGLEHIGRVVCVNDGHSAGVIGWRAHPHQAGQVLVVLWFMILELAENMWIKRLIDFTYFHSITTSFVNKYEPSEHMKT